MRRTLALVCLTLLGGPAFCSARTMTVGPAGDRDTTSIQAAIDLSADGETIIVCPAVYFENIHFDGKNIILQSSDPTDTTTVATTIIDGRSSGSVVTFAGTEGNSCVLSGFTIRNGRADRGGGIAGNGCLATIERNVIKNNAANGGGGLADCNGAIGKNEVSFNTAPIGYGSEYAGAGLAYCNGTIEDNTITRNLFAHLSQVVGGGLAHCNGVIQGNTISQNGATSGGAFAYCQGSIRHNEIVLNRSYQAGGGLYECNGTVFNNLIAGNRQWACRESVSEQYRGGGLCDCRGAITNNTIVGNSADSSGGGLSGCTGALVNCIIWGNTAPTSPGLHQSSVPSFSCIQDWTAGGAGNFSADPRFTTGPMGTYYLSQTAAGQSLQSPCVNAGSSTALAAALAHRTTRTDQVTDDGTVDMGFHYRVLPLPPADLTGTLWDVSPRDVEIGQTIQFSGAVTNAGGQRSTATVWVEFWAINPQSGRARFLCDSILVGPLEPGQSFDLAAIAPPRAVYEDITPGTYTLEMRIDTTNLVPEWTEGNNTARWAGLRILPKRPNLVVRDFDFSPQDTAPSGGTTVTFAGEVRNIGTGATARGFWIEFRLWPDAEYHATGPYLCDSYPIAQTVAAGESIALPALAPRATYALPAGVYVVGVVLDPLNEVEESREDDNMTWRARKKLYVGPRPSAVARWNLYR